MAGTQQLTEADFDVMSDEEFLRVTGSMDIGIPTTQDAGDDGDQGHVLETDAPAAQEVDDEPNEELENDQPHEEGDQGDDPSAAQLGSEEEGQAGNAGEGSGQDGGDQGTDATDYKALYEKVMGPIKANGTTFTPSSPDEVVRLMQMGANYTKKMQAMQPHLKLLRTLEGKGLLSEERINYLIDLSENNPQAIQKLLHESKIDPLDIDTSAQPTYQPGNHTISDVQMEFQDTIAALTESEHGKETIRHVHSTWDQASKQAVFEEPALLKTITQQRANGIYAKITSEMDRKRILGELPNVPFIHAYKIVGDELHAKGLLVGGGQAQASAAPAFQPAANPAVNTRPARPRSQGASRDQVRAISSAPGSNHRSPTKEFDPLKMSDAEIMAITSRR